MKSVWTTLGAIAAAAGIAYLLKDNENVKGTLDKINEEANNAMGKMSTSWRKATEKFHQMQFTKT